MEADKAAASGGSAAPGDGGEKKAEEKKEAPATEIDYKAKLLAHLGLDETADEAAIDAKAAEIKEAAGKVPDLETAAAGASDAATKLQAANEELERVRSEYQTLFERDQAAQKAAQEAEVDAILEQFADRLTDEKAKARIRAILVNDREAGMEILNGLAKPAAPGEGGPEKEKATPPAPKHDPENATAASQPTEEEIAQKTRARAAEIAKKFPKKQTAEVWAQAEKEIRAEIANSQSA